MLGKNGVVSSTLSLLTRVFFLKKKKQWQVGKGRKGRLRQVPDELCTKCYWQTERIVRQDFRKDDVTIASHMLKKRNYGGGDKEGVIGGGGGGDKEEAIRGGKENEEETKREKGKKHSRWKWRWREKYTASDRGEEDKEKRQRERERERWF